MIMYDPAAIKALRESLKLTPTQFAARLGVSASTVCLWEKGDRHPKYDTMIKMNQLAAESKNGRRKELAGAK